MYLPTGFSVTAPWAFNWFLDGNANKVDISIGSKTNGKIFLINAHGALLRKFPVVYVYDLCIYTILESQRIAYL